MRHAEPALESSLRNCVPWGADFSSRDRLSSPPRASAMAPTADRRHSVHRSHVWADFWLVLCQQSHDSFSTGAGTGRSSVDVIPHNRNWSGGCNPECYRHYRISRSTESPGLFNPQGRFALDTWWLGACHPRVRSTLSGNLALSSKPAPPGLLLHTGVHPCVIHGLDTGSSAGADGICCRNAAAPHTIRAASRPTGERSNLGSVRHLRGVPYEPLRMATNKLLHGGRTDPFRHLTSSLLSTDIPGRTHRHSRALGLRRSGRATRETIFGRNH